MRAQHALALAIFVTSAVGISAALYLNVPGKTTPHSATRAPFGAPFTLTDHNGDAVSEAIFRGRPAAVDVRLHLLPGYLPDDAGGNGFLVEGAGQRG